MTLLPFAACPSGPDTITSDGYHIVAPDPNGEQAGHAITRAIQLAGLQPSDIDACIIGCDVPPLIPTFQAVCKKYFGIEPLVVGHGIRTGVRILYDNPKQLGGILDVNNVVARRGQGIHQGGMGVAGIAQQPGFLGPQRQQRTSHKQPSQDNGVHRQAHGNRDIISATLTERHRCSSLHANHLRLTRTDI